MESENIWMDTFVFCIKIYWYIVVYLELRMDLLPMHYFVMSYIGHLENSSSASYVYLPNADTFHFEISKTHVH